MYLANQQKIDNSIKYVDNSVSLIDNSINQVCLSRIDNSIKYFLMNIILILVKCVVYYILNI